MTQKQANGISSAIMLFGLAIVAFTHAWWPGILLAIGVSAIVRGVLNAHFGEALASFLIFGGLFFYFQYPNIIPSEHILPLIFVIIGVIVLIKEFSKKGKKKR